VFTEAAREAIASLGQVLLDILLAHEPESGLKIRGVRTVVDCFMDSLASAEILDRDRQGIGVTREWD